MTHSLITPIRTSMGYQSGCTCGYLTNVFVSLFVAENNAKSHIRLSLNDPPVRPIQRERPDITLGEAAAGFWRLLERGLDENVPAQRGGWPR